MQHTEPDYFDFLYKHTGRGKILCPNIKYIVSNINQNYHKEEKTKGDGSIRVIDKPSRNLKTIQRKILTDISRINKERNIISKQVFGLGGDNQIQNVSPHRENRYVFKVDLRNFFNSVDYEKVKKVFISLGCSEEEANILTRLTTYNYYIPQGVPTSSILASICLRNCDKHIENLCKQLGGMVYTRYLDDITISGESKITSKTQAKIEAIISQEGLEINKEKTKVFDTRNEPCKITGIILQNKQIRTEYHHGEERHNFIRENTPINQNNTTLMGVLEWIRNVDPEYYNILITERRCPLCD